MTRTSGPFWAILFLYTQAIPNTEKWQVITNSPSYNISIETQQSACTRFNYIYNVLEQYNGSLSSQEGLNVLSNIGWNNATEWSTIYSITDKSVSVAIDYDFNKIYNFTIN